MGRRSRGRHGRRAGRRRRRRHRGLVQSGRAGAAFGLELRGLRERRRVQPQQLPRHGRQPGQSALRRHFQREPAGPRPGPDLRPDQPGARGHVGHLRRSRGRRRLVPGLRALRGNGPVRGHLPGDRPHAHRARRAASERPRVQQHRPVSHRPERPGGPARVRPRLLRQHPARRGRGPGRARPHLLRAVHGLRQLREQGPVRDRPRGVPGERVRLDEVRVRPGRAAQPRNLPTRGHRASR